VLDEAVRVGDRNHLVVNPVHHERRMADGVEFREALRGEALPLTECRHLRISATSGPRHAVQVVFSAQPIAQRTRLRPPWPLAVSVKKIFCRTTVPLVRGILQMCREPRLFEVHDVFGRRAAPCRQGSRARKIVGRSSTMC